MISGRKLACTGAAKELSGTPGRGRHAVAWLVHPLARRGVEGTLYHGLGASSGMPGCGIHAVAWLGASSGTLRCGIPRYSVAPAQC